MRSGESCTRPRSFPRSSAKFQTFFLDADKLTAAPKPGQSTFHVLYYLWEGADEQQRTLLGLDQLERPFFEPLSSAEDRSAAQQGWQQVRRVFDRLRLSDAQQQGVLNVLAAILHLMHSGAQGAQAARSAFGRASSAQRAAELLGMSFDELSLAVFRGQQGADSGS